MAAPYADLAQILPKMAQNGPDLAQNGPDLAQQIFWFVHHDHWALAHPAAGSGVCCPESKIFG
jgi:hypothetical protein